MALVIRFANAGRRGERKYKLVVCEKRSRRDGRPVELLGTYEKRVGNVVTKDINMEKVQEWIKKGALLSTGAKKVLEPKN
ncbi:MAG: 30S ribosomal protein S16 [Candidatus Levybacteria bacterium]|nr:30S ribosomal protein S16 [Candidatus Levybacteria bacterium]